MTLVDTWFLGLVLFTALRVPLVVRERTVVALVARHTVQAQNCPWI